MNNSNLTKQTILNSTPSSLLGEVNLDNYSSKMTKCNVYKTSVKHEDEDRLYSTNRQRTSSHTNGIQPENVKKRFEDEFRF